MNSISTLLFRLPVHFRIDDINIREEQVTITAQSTKRKAYCSNCRIPSKRVHSYYQRIPRDLPCGIYCVRLNSTVKRFRCNNPDCVRKTFTEQSPAFLQPHAQNTQRLNQLLTKIVSEINGEAGHRICKLLKIKASPDTLIRCIRKMIPSVVTSPKVIGIDDWSMRKGTNFGTLIVDLERRCPIEVLPERTAECVTKWLTAHPTIEVVCRDRYHDYIKGIHAGAPNAIQIADRWHLLKNISDTVQRICADFSEELQTIANEFADLPSAPDTKPLPQRSSNRQIVFDEAKKLIAAGHSDRAIARMMPIHRSTVAKYRRLDVLPDIRRTGYD